MMIRLTLALVFVLVPTRSADAQAQRWWEDVKALSADSMRGRETGSPEHRKAADYIAAAFRQAHLEPGGNRGFLQPVNFVARTIDESRSSLAIVRDGQEEPLSLGEDAAFVLRAPLAAKVDAPLIFAGYGLKLPEFGRDDIAGLDLNGKVAVILAGAPGGIPGPVLSHARNQIWTALREAGAAGMIAFSSTRANDSVFVRAARNRLAPQMSLADPALDLLAGNRLSIQWNGARGEKLFAGAPERFAALVARADSGLPLPHFDLPVRIRSTVQLDQRPITSQNVIGILRGRDPDLRDEYVVLTAHIDHLGVGHAVDGDSIYNGAMDNASGAALLMDVARMLGSRRNGLRRSVLFVAVTGEEKGLLGSRFYANHPTVPVKSIVADLNTDMFLPIIQSKLIMVNGLEESDLADDALRASMATEVDVVTDPEPEENRFVRSDQYSFILRGIPALSLKVGFVRDSPEHAVIKEFRSRRYHQPSDDVDQPVSLETAARFEHFYVTLVAEVANRETRPAWRTDSYFRRLAIGGSARKR